MEMNHQKPERKPRKAPPKKRAPENEVKKEVSNVMKTQTHCPPLIGRSPNYVERVGLGTLRVISAEGLAEENNG